jgi:hypothetical protein
MKPYNGIEFVWGGTWLRSHRKYMQPIIKTVLGLTEDITGDLGVEPRTSKRAAIYQCSRTWPTSGESYDQTKFDLNYPADRIARRKIARSDLEIIDSVQYAFHELLHCVRFETHQVDSLLEYAASEGISYLGATLAASILDGERVFDAFGIAANFTQSFRNSLLDKLLIDEQSNNGDDKPGTGPMFEEWFEVSDKKQELPLGPILGMLSVVDLYYQGMAFGEIITLPAERIMFAGVRLGNEAAA